MKGVIVYIFKEGSASSGELSSDSAITDAGGRYSFSNLSTGTYRVRPDLEGTTFVPASFTADTGVVAQRVEGIVTEYDNPTCQTRVYSTRFAESDSAGKDLLTYGLNRIDFFQNEAAMWLSVEEEARLNLTLNQYKRQLPNAYKSIMKTSLSIPKASTKCNRETKCAQKKYDRRVSGYNKRLATMKKIIDASIEKAQKDFNTIREYPFEAYSIETRALYEEAVRKTKRLPRKISICSPD